MNKWICRCCDTVIYSMDKPKGFTCSNPDWGLFMCYWVQFPIRDWEIKAIQAGWTPPK